MELQVSKKTIKRISNKYDQSNFITNKEIPDLNCKHVGEHLQRDSNYETVEYCNINVENNNSLGILYNRGIYNKRDIVSRAKKYKI